MLNVFEATHQQCRSHFQIEQVCKVSHFQVEQVCKVSHIQVEQVCKVSHFQIEQDCITETKNLLCSKSTTTLCYGTKWKTWVKCYVWNVTKQKSSYTQYACAIQNLTMWLSYTELRNLFPMNCVVCLTILVRYPVKF